MHRRNLFRLGAAGAFGAVLGQRIAQAQTQTTDVLSSTVHLVVPFTPGASNDLFARALSEPLGRLFGVPVVVDNKPGAGGIVGSAEVARAKPDGCTLLLSSNSFVTRAAVDTKLPFDPKISFSPVAMVAQGAMVLVVGNETPLRNIKDLLAAAKAKPLTYASAGVGSIGQMSAELLNSMAGVNMTHVPYKGISPALTDVMRGRVDMMITTPASVGGALQAGQIRALGVTSLAASPYFPGLPVIAADVPGYTVDVWWGVFAPAGLPAMLLDQLNKAICDTAATPKLRELLARESADPVTMNAREFAAHVSNEVDKWSNVAKSRGIKLTE